jgi:CheY-like chemotaxis protein
MRVLIVDDDGAIRDVLRDVLEDDGYVVDEVRDGVQALDALRASPDSLVVLLDLMMPNLDGAGMLQAVARDPHLAGRHAFLLMTAGSPTLPLALVELMSAMDIALQPKPFEMDDLLGHVARLVARLERAAPARAPMTPRRARR